MKWIIAVIISGLTLMSSGIYLAWGFSGLKTWCIGSLIVFGALLVIGGIVAIGEECGGE